MSSQANAKEAKKVPPDNQTGARRRRPVRRRAFTIATLNEAMHSKEALSENTALEDALAHALGPGPDPLHGLVSELAFIAESLRHRCETSCRPYVPNLEEMATGADLIEAKAAALKVLIYHMWK